MSLLGPVGPGCNRHVVTGNPMPDSTGTGMDDDPYSLILIHADFQEVVTGTQGSRCRISTTGIEDLLGIRSQFTLDIHFGGLCIRLVPYRNSLIDLLENRLSLGSNRILVEGGRQRTHTTTDIVANPGRQNVAFNCHDTTDRQ